MVARLSTLQAAGIYAAAYRLIDVGEVHPGAGLFERCHSQLFSAMALPIFTLACVLVAGCCLE